MKTLIKGLLISLLIFVSPLALGDEKPLTLEQYQAKLVKERCGKSEDIYKQLDKEGYVPLLRSDDGMNDGNKTFFAFSFKNKEWRTYSVFDTGMMCLEGYGTEVQFNRSNLKSVIEQMNLYGPTV